jgi:hypothetical protein
MILSLLTSLALASMTADEEISICLTLQAPEDRQCLRSVRRSIEAGEAPAAEVLSALGSRVSCEDDRLGPVLEQIHAPLVARAWYAEARLLPLRCAVSRASPASVGYLRSWTEGPGQGGRLSRAEWSSLRESCKRFHLAECLPLVGISEFRAGLAGQEAPWVGALVPVPSSDLALQAAAGRALCQLKVPSSAVSARPRVARLAFAAASCGTPSEASTLALAILGDPRADPTELQQAVALARTLSKPEALAAVQACAADRRRSETDRAICAGL